MAILIKICIKILGLEGCFTRSFHAFCVSMQSVNHNLIVPLSRVTSVVVSSNFFQIFHLDARVVKRFRGCVADLILVGVYSSVIARFFAFYYKLKIWSFEKLSANAGYPLFCSSL